MQVSNAQIYNSVSALRVLAGLDLPVKTSFVISRNISKIQEVMAIFETERKKLVDKHANRDESGTILIIESDQGKQASLADVAAFTKDFTELLEIMVDLDVKEINIDALGNINLSPNILSALDWLIVE